MKKILILVVLLFAAYQYHPQWFDLFSKSGSFDEEGQPSATLYVAKDCGGYCEQAIDYFQSRSIPVDIIDIDTAEGFQRYRGQSGSGKIPLLHVGQQKMEGYHQDRYSEMSFEIVGTRALSWAQKKTFAAHFDDEGKAKVVMYATSWCGYCKQARQRMTELGIPFTEWDVERNSAAKTRYDVLKFSGYPAIYVGTRRVGSYNENKILSYLD